MKSHKFFLNIRSVLAMVAAVVVLSLFVLDAPLTRRVLASNSKQLPSESTASVGSAIIVNTLSDTSGSTDGLCSLREAIVSANGNIPSGNIPGECIAGSSTGVDTIRFTVAGTINLLSGLNSLSTDINIEGPGAKLLTIRRDTGGLFRIFSFGSGITASLSGLTISNGALVGNSFPGSAGAGVLNQGNLTMNDCVVTNNQTDGVGGGIANAGTLFANNCTISSNTATSSGGGIVNSADGFVVLKLRNSTVSNNASQSSGGGLYNGGITDIKSSTISTNTAPGGGGISNIGTLTLGNVTVTANSATNFGGGILNPGIGSLTFNNTLIAGNTAPNGPDASGASLLSDDFNLIGNSIGIQINGTTTHNIINVDARLGPLAENGGPTLTHELLDGSPAIDAGSSPFSKDQRGKNRPVDHPNIANATNGNTSDIGAYEAPAFQINSIADTDDGACTLLPTGNGCTLREAINAANTNAGAEEITFATSLTSGGPATITLLTALPNLASNMTVTGPNADLLTVSRSSSGGISEFRVFTINSGRTVTIAGLTISNGLMTGTNVRGGGVINNGMLTMQSCNLYGNSASSGGGGIYNDGPSLIMRDCNVGGTSRFQGNSGGGVHHNGGNGVMPNSGSLLITGGSIAGNSGGGISIIAPATIDGVNIFENVGSGIFIASNAVTNILNCLITNNTSSFNGGGLYNSLSTTNVVNTTISENTANSAGGGIYSFNSANLTLTNVTITNNRASTFQGGGIDASGGVHLRNSIVAGNFRGASPGTTADDIAGIVDPPTSSFNVIGTGGSGQLVNGVNNNQVGVNPLLGTLANNGGPTLTHALLASSPALDAGNNSLVANPLFAGPPFTDQRRTGFSRIIDGPDVDTTATVDVGAFEQQVQLSELADTSVNEDTQLILPFDIGDRSTVTSVTATSSGGVVPNDPAHLLVTDAGSTEVLTINPATNLSGVTAITVTVNRTGGSSTKVFSLTVNPVNDAPTFTRGLDQIVKEDFGPRFLSTWAIEASSGASDEQQTLTFQVSGNSNPGLFSAQPTINSSGGLSFTPAANAFGTAAVTVVLKDDGGTANGGSDTSLPQAFNIIITPVNDAPSFTAGANPTANEDAGPQVVTNWATNISAGAPNESGQVLTFEITSNSNSALFSAGPSISSTGTLSFTTAANLNGSASIGVRLKDNGGVGDGGQDTSSTRFFTITVNSVNDAPTFTKGPDQSVNNNAGQQTVNNWATNMSPGPADESSQTLLFLISGNTNPNLFSSPPAISSSGTLMYTPATNGGGSATITVVLRDSGGTANGGQNTSASQTFTINVTPVGGTISFSGANFTTTESSGFATITAQRSGDTARAVTVDFASGNDSGLPCSTTNGSAISKCDFTAAYGVLKFAAAETTKTFSVLISQDSYVEGPETLTLSLSNATGFAAIGAQSTATLTITDDASEPSSNPIDDSMNFVRQHYHDFLSREPDQNGWDYWTGQITQCGDDQACLRAKRIDVSNAFFYELEYQQTGSYVYRLYRAAFGNNQPFPNPNANPQYPNEEKKIPSYAVFASDRARVKGGANLAQLQLDLANAFVLRPEFVSRYSASQDGPSFVDALLALMNSDLGVDMSSQRTALIDLLNQGGRGAVLYRLADDNIQTNPINNRAFIDAEYNRAFVVTQYFGYLRRNPDIAGFLFWLGQVNGAALRDVSKQHAMVCSFLTSTEYQQRFSSIVTHNNTECGQ